MKMVTDPTLDDDRWGLFVPYKRKFWFEKNDYDVPESYFYQNGEEIQPNTIELVKRFLKQVRESRGYDVDCYPPPMFKSPFSPLPLERMRQGTSYIDTCGYARVVGAAELAIQDICEETGHRYKLVKVERAVMVLTRPGVYFLTLTAEEDGVPVQTIQAQVGKLLLDALIYPGIMTIVLKNSVLTTFHTSDDGDSNEKVVARPFLMRTKTKEDREKLAAAIQDCAPASRDSQIRQDREEKP
ncbi:RanBP1 domain-containing protein [Striga asiatica]|uniref:RanBP1 domain-containing protein n=1 Tax=Striga asiatica TaxID=4170 RepID=A0A5A7R0T2_STRAF|nr:RanBP1 domain-containing protein [Striga asiatica]